jgi:hypothetical protein
VLSILSLPNVALAVLSGKMAKAWGGYPAAHQLITPVHGLALIDAE